MKINLSGFKSAARFIFTKPIKSDITRDTKAEGRETQQRA